VSDLDDLSARLLLGRTGFNDGAAYDAHRPGYRPEVVHHLLSTLGLQPGDQVVDLGAGTGKFTRALAAAGLEVLAVEPSEAMRAELLRQSPEVAVVEGDDQHIPAAAGSIRAVFVAQAFHWFDVEPALAEIARVLAPGGGLGLLWNERDQSVPWVWDLHVAMLWHERQPYAVGRDFRADMARGPFVGIERRQFTFTDRLTHDELLQRVLTTSYITIMGGGERAAILADVGAVVADLGSPVDLPYVTDVFTGRRAGGE
jgi:SAM-dependent methyltransferase